MTVGRSILIENAAIVTVDDSFTILDPGWLLTIDDTIAELGAGEAPASIRSSATEIIDGTGMAVMPGMVNGHTHLFQTFFRGLADDKGLLDWLRDCIWPGAIHLTAELAYHAALVGLMENLRTGATSVIDHQYIHIDPAIDDAVCQAADDLGVRFLLARGWADRNYEPQLTETVETVIAHTTALRDRWEPRSARIRIELAPLIPWGCSDDAVKSTVALARSWGAGTHVHCAETQDEINMSLDERGVRHVPWLESVGALGPDVQLAHSVWLDDEELDLIASSGSVVVHCPTSNMYLASGVARIPEMRARGIDIALASDGPGSNNRQDMFEAMKLTALLQKVHTLNPVVLQPEDVLVMACRGGSAAFGMRSDIGALMPGRKADLVLVNLQSVFVAPVHRVPSALVYNCSTQDVYTVIVDGEVVVRDREIVRVNERAALAKANRACAELMRKAGLPSRLVP